MKKIILVSMTLLLLAVCSTLFSLSSCTKTFADTKTDTVYKCQSTINGLWIGSVTVDGRPDMTHYYSLIIKPDGTMINDTKNAQGTQDLNVGKWTLLGDTLTCITTCVYGIPENLGIVEKHTAIFNQSTGTLTSGTWENYPNPYGKGTFTVTKVN